MLSLLLTNVILLHTLGTLGTMTSLAPTNYAKRAKKSIALFKLQFPNLDPFNQDNQSNQSITKTTATAESKTVVFSNKSNSFGVKGVKDDAKDSLVSRAEVLASSAAGVALGVSMKNGVFVIPTRPIDRCHKNTCVCDECSLYYAWCRPSEYYEETVASTSVFRGTKDECEKKYETVYKVLIDQYKCTYGCTSITDFEARINYLCHVASSLVLSVDSKLKWIDYLFSHDQNNLFPSSGQYKEFIVQHRSAKLMEELKNGFAHYHSNTLSADEWLSRLTSTVNAIETDMSSKSISETLARRHSFLLETLITKLGNMEVGVQWLTKVAFPKIFKFSDAEAKGRLPEDVLKRLNSTNSNKECHELYTAFGHGTVHLCRTLLQWGAIPNDLCAREVLSRHKEWSFDDQKEMISEIFKYSAKCFNLNWFSHIMTTDVKQRTYWFNLGWEMFSSMTWGERNDFFCGIACSISNLLSRNNFNKDDWNWYQEHRLLRFANGWFLEQPNIPTTQKLSTLQGLVDNGWDFCRAFERGDFVKTLVKGCDPVVAQVLLDAKWMEITSAKVEVEIKAKSNFQSQTASDADASNHKNQLIDQKSTIVAVVCKIEEFWPEWFLGLQNRNLTQVTSVERWIEMGKWILSKCPETVAANWWVSKYSFYHGPCRCEEEDSALQWFTKTLGDTISHANILLAAKREEQIKKENRVHQSQSKNVQWKNIDYFVWPYDSDND